MCVSRAADGSDDPFRAVLDITGLGAQPIDATWEEMYVIIKSEARRILEVAREALMKRGATEASVIEILLEGTRLKK
jgi:hypothetical protein